jgi:hypothetical protein
MPARALELGFLELERTWAMAALPSPGEIRELGLRLLADEQQHQRSLKNWRERDELERRRREHPEEFMGLGDLASIARNRGVTLSADADPPPSSPAEQRQDERERVAKLGRQSRYLREVAGKPLVPEITIDPDTNHFRAKFEFSAIGNSREEACEELAELVRAAGLAKFVPSSLTVSEDEPKLEGNNG